MIRTDDEFMYQDLSMVRHSISSIPHSATQTSSACCATSKATSAFNRNRRFDQRILYTPRRASILDVRHTSFIQQRWKQESTKHNFQMRGGSSLLNMFWAYDEEPWKQLSFGNILAVIQFVEEFGWRSLALLDGSFDGTKNDLKMILDISQGQTQDYWITIWNTYGDSSS